MAKPTKPCGVPLQLDRDRQPDLDGPRCTYHRKPTKVKCTWHWLMSQPIEVQVRAAEAREKVYLEGPLPRRDRVPASEWPEGQRWCSGCQTFVPLFYSQGSRCRACNSRAAHASHVQRTYGLSAAQYQALLEWQGGVCFICGQVPRKRRLAVDHDHRTGEVRGLLCANDEWGCNVTLRRLLNDVEMARRALEYVEQRPLERMQSGQPRRGRPQRPDTLELTRRSRAGQDGPGAPPAVSLDHWDPFGAQSA